MSYCNDEVKSLFVRGLEVYVCVARQHGLNIAGVIIFCLCFNIRTCRRRLLEVFIFLYV